MATLNKVMLIGRLTDNPEPPRTLPNSGSTVIKFRFAVGRSRQTPQTGRGAAAGGKAVPPDRRNMTRATTTTAVAATAAAVAPGKTSPSDRRAADDLRTPRGHDCERAARVNPDRPMTHTNGVRIMAK